MLQLPIVSVAFVVIGCVGVAMTIANFAEGTYRVELTAVGLWIGLQLYRRDIRVLKWARRLAMLCLIISLLAAWTLFVQRDDPRLLGVRILSLSTSQYLVWSLVEAAVSLSQYLVLRSRGMRVLFGAERPLPST